MARYAIDARTLLHLIDHGLAIDPAHQLVAAKGIHSDLLTLLLADVRRGVRTESEALTVHTRATEQRMRLLGDRVSRRTAWELALAHDWGDLHDAETLAVARLQADALVTVDEALAARADGIVPLAPLEALLVGG